MSLTIKEMTGIVVSPKLLAFIMNSDKLNGLNKNALKDIVVEYSPINQKFNMILDGSAEIRKVGMFSFFLSCRITNMPELQEILESTKQPRDI